MNIPHMGGRTIGPWLELFAAEAEECTAIIEFGTWLGAGTEFLARGAQGRNIKVHTYDIFKTRGNEVDKAAFQGVDLRPKQNTLPLVQGFLRDYDNIVFHKGRISESKWNGPKISVQVDDACKMPAEFSYVINMFSPYWIPEKTILVLMDYSYYLKRPDIPELECQKKYIESHAKNFELIKDWPITACAAFRYLGGDVRYSL